MKGRRIRVAIVAPTLAILGGHSVQANELVRRWRAHPDVEAWLVPINPSAPRGLGFTARIKYLRTLVTESIYLAQLMRQLAQADLVHVFSASYLSFLLAPLPALVIARLFGRPVVLNYHSGLASDHFRRSTTARAALKLANRVVVPSSFLAEIFRQHGVDAAVVPNTVDLERFRFRERDPIRPRILSTRNLDDPYNVACTLRAFRDIQHRVPDATLTIVGSGRHEQALRRLSVDLRLVNVHFTGRVDPRSIPLLYDEHDIYLQSPDADNMPLSVLEAFASGLAVVSTEAGGIPAMLANGTHGLLAPVGDHERLAAHVLRLLDEPRLARRLAQSAYDRCRRYEWANVCGEWLDLYQHVVGARPCTAAARGQLS